MRVVNVDLDGVGYDFTEAMRNEFALYAQEHWNDSMLEDPQQWEVWKTWGISNEVFTGVMHRGIMDGRVFGVGKPIPGFIEGLTMLRANGWHVRIVTNKIFARANLRYMALTSCVTWLDDYSVPYDTISFTDSKLGKEPIRADAIIDDKPDATHWAQMGSKNIIFDQPWNQDAPPHLIRCVGWTEVLEELL